MKNSLLDCRKSLVRAGVSVVVLLGAGVFATVVGADERVQYSRDVRPILTENCFACHGADDASREADLRLDLREAATDYGAIVPGEPESSTLIERVLTDDPDLVMPPHHTKKQLTKEQIAILQEWVAGGAEYEEHWAFAPPERPALPAVSESEWAKNAIDRFVLARLDAAGLRPAMEADARTLFRRLHLDITGLPPMPSDVEEFVDDYEANADAAIDRWIDRLMELPAWGEHRARYWLDAARYADTHGIHFDNYREMWPYRDWVIQAYNSNQRFDEFAVEQLAGDLLPEPTDEQLIATGFQRCNPTTNEGGTIAEENLANYAADRVQTFGWVFLGLTTNCAQCHDHKFDPLTMRDYYSLAAFFRNTKAPALDGNAKDGRGPILVVPSADDRPRWEALPAEIAQAKQKVEHHRKQAEIDFEEWLASATPESMGANASVEGLQIHLPLDEGEGRIVRNLASAGSNSEFDEATTWQADGPLGPAPVLGSGRTLDLGAAGDFEFDQAFSFGCWMKTPSPNQAASVLARMDVAQRHRGWDLYLAGGKLSVHLIDSWFDNAIKVTTQKQVVPGDTWLHVAVTYDGSATPEGIKIYINGEFTPHKIDRKTLQSGATMRTSTPLRVGQRSSGSVLQDGSVQDVRLYDRQLESGDVEVMAKSPVLAQFLTMRPEERSDADRKAALASYLAVVDSEYRSLAAKRSALESEQATIRGRSPITHIQEEKPNSQAMAHILMRGAYDQPGEQVAADTPASLHPMPEGTPRNRLGLARWVVDQRNPLTARVTVNRFWQQVFGQGLVPTTEDFGVSGSLPSHPELLDWLAVEFVESDWNVKHLFKLMLTSATYRQSARTAPEKLEVDPANELLARGPRFRMDAEMVRDFALAASDSLSPRMFGPGTKPYQPDDIWNIVGLPGGDTRKYVQDKGENLYRRTIYNFWKRMAPPPNLEAFNAPSREVCTVRRERTNTPLQALVTLNDPQFVEAARRLAGIALQDTAKPEEIARHMALRVLGRPLADDEQGLLLGAQEHFRAYYVSNPSDAQALIDVGDSPTPDVDDPASLAAWTMVASQMLNLDETLNK